MMGNYITISVPLLIELRPAYKWSLHFDELRRDREQQQRRVHVFTSLSEKTALRQSIHELQQIATVS